MGLPVWRSWRLMGSVVDTGHPFCGSEDAFDEQVLRLPVVENTRSVHKAVSIVGTIYKPRGEGPFPLVVINHGSNRNAVDRVRPRRFGFASQSREFIRRGFVVLVPTRRGYGDSEGPLVESYQRDESRRFSSAGVDHRSGYPGRNRFYATTTLRRFLSDRYCRTFRRRIWLPCSWKPVGGRPERSDQLQWSARQQDER